VPWLRRLVVGLPARIPEFDPRSINVDFLEDKMTLGQGFSSIISVVPYIIISELADDQYFIESLNKTLNKPRRHYHYVNYYTLVE